MISAAPQWTHFRVGASDTALRHIGTGTIAHDLPPRDNRESDTLWTVNPLRPAGTIQTRRLSNILRDNEDEICQRILAAMKGNPELSALPLSDEERLDHIRNTLRELVEKLEAHPQEATALPAAAKTGEERLQQESHLSAFRKCETSTGSDLRHNSREFIVDKLEPPYA